MRRRTFVTALIGVAVWPAAGTAQEVPGIPLGGIAPSGREAPAGGRVPKSFI